MVDHDLADVPGGVDPDPEVVGGDGIHDLLDSPEVFDDGARNDVFYDYNYQHHGVMGYRRWFESRNHMFQHYFGIYLEERFIGFIGIKKINPLTKNSELGLVIDPNFTNRGIGLETMVLFLEHYFFKLKMKTMTLKVTKYNKDAIKLYRKLGFRFIGESRTLLEIKTSDLMHPEVQKYAFYLHRDCFGRI